MPEILILTVSILGILSFLNDERTTIITDNDPTKPATLRAFTLITFPYIMFLIGLITAIYFEL